jgi:hypothetical protein
MSLFQAATSGTLQEIETRLKHGADINERNKNGETPLHRAAAFNTNVAILNALITNGAHLNAKDKDHGQTPLHYAVLNNAPARILESLIRHGADVHAHDKNGITPLDAAQTDEKKQIMLKAMQGPAPTPSNAEMANSQAGKKDVLQSEGNFVPPALSDEELKIKRAESEKKLDDILLERRKIEDVLNDAKHKFIEGGKIIKDVKTKFESIAKIYADESSEAKMAMDPDYIQGCKVVSEAKSKISSAEHALKEFDHQNAPNKAEYRHELDRINNLLELDAISRAEHVYQYLLKRMNNPCTEGELIALAEDFRSQLSGYKNSATLAMDCENTAKPLAAERKRREMVEITKEMAVENYRDKTVHRILLSSIPGWIWFPISLILLKPGEIANSGCLNIFVFMGLWGASVFFTYRLCKKFQAEWYYFIVPIAAWMILFSTVGCPPRFMGPGNNEQGSEESDRL